jgi:hypothetical protein
MRDFLVSLREYNCDQWTQSSLAIQLEAQQKEAERKQVWFSGVGKGRRGRESTDGEREVQYVEVCRGLGEVCRGLGEVSRGLWRSRRGSSRTVEVSARSVEVSARSRRGLSRSLEVSARSLAVSRGPGEVSRFLSRSRRGFLSSLTFSLVCLWFRALRLDRFWLAGRGGEMAICARAHACHATGGGDDIVGRLLRSARSTGSRHGPYVSAIACAALAAQT